LPETVAPAEIRSNKFAIDGASVLVSKLNPRIPRIWDVPGPISAAVASTEFLVLTARGCSSSVLWAILSRPDFSNALRERVAGTSGSHQRVRPDDAMSVLVVDPMQLTPELQSEITGLGAIACSKRQESQVLAQMRDALLPKLMSGELRVKGVEKTVEEVL
jgi:type I restriction enzyme S subunit